MLALIPQAAKGVSACYGFYEIRDGQPFAVENEVWTFDHGAPDSLEGWVGEHPIGPDGYEVVRWRQLADFAGDGLPTGAPIIAGSGIVWVGVHDDEADSLCFECGLGYGQGWSQKIVSPRIPYSGSGDVDLTFEYWTDFDPTVSAPAFRIIGISDSSSVSLVDEFIDDGPETWSTPALGSAVLPEATAASFDSLAIEFLFFSGGQGTDEDCSFDSQFGAFGVDNVSISGGATAFFDFEGSAQGWINQISGTPDGIHVAANDLSSYGQGWESWPDCDADGRVLTFHDLPAAFSNDFFEAAVSPTIDISNLNLTVLDSVSMSFDELHDYDGQPCPNLLWDVQTRTFTDSCPLTGQQRWSDWDTVDGSFNITVGDACTPYTFDLTSAIAGLPDLIQVRIRVSHSLGGHPVCVGPSNQTPFFDNIQVCVQGQSPSDVPDEWMLVDGAVSMRVGPNPLTTTSSVFLDVLDGPRQIEITLHDVSGRLVGVVTDGALDEGSHTFPVADLAGVSGLGALDKSAAGVYFLRFHSTGYRRVTKLVLLQ